MKPYASIIIPAFNHAQYLPDAIDSALAQTLPCEVIVIDDGSSDHTREVIEDYARAGVRVIIFSHNRGVAAARNAGIDAARCEYLMLLDADDTIEPSKVERQIAELEAHPAAGWCLCDVRIIDDVGRKDEPASKRYGYDAMTLDGRIGDYLTARNFMPVHSPLIWRPALSGIRFRNMDLEDWTFWRELASIASCCYVPEVLATYNARATGRNRQRKC